MINASIALSLLGGGTSSSTSTMTALAAFTSYSKDQVAARTSFAGTATVTDAIEDFKTAAKKLDSVDDLLADRKTLSFVLSAFGLESDIDNIGKLRAVIESDPDDVDSYANRLTDTRYGELAAFLDTAEFGVTRLKVSDKQSELITGYLTNEFEKSIGTKNEAARDALFFLRRINEVETAYDILADLSLRSIVTDALNLPDEIANQSVEKQAALIEAGIDLEAFQTSGAASGSASRLDTLTADLDAISSAAGAISAGLTAVDSVVEGLAALRDLYAAYDQTIDPVGINAEEIPIQRAAIPDLLTQRGLLEAASVAIDETATALDEIELLYNRALNAEDADELAEIKAGIEAAITRVAGTEGSIAGATYTDPNGGSTRNLLLNGSSGTLPDGITATAASISTLVDSDGTRAVTKSSDLSGFLADLRGFGDAVAAAEFGTLAEDLRAAGSLLAEAEADFGTAELQNQINRYSLDNALGSVTFAVEIDTAAVAGGLAAVDDALSRVDKIAETLQAIEDLAEEAPAEDADLDSVNAQYESHVARLTALAATAGGDGELDNLLDGETRTYRVLDGAVVQAEGHDLLASIVDDLPEAITADNAGDLDAAVDGTFAQALDAAVDGLTRDRRVIAFAAETVDPLGALDARITVLGDELATLIDGAEVDGENLLSPYAADLKVNLNSLGSAITVDAQSGFAGAMGAAFGNFTATVLSGGSIADRVRAVNDALFAAGRVQAGLQAEAAALAIQRQIVSSEKEAIGGDGGSGDAFLQEQEYSSEALKFIERYLVQKDLEAAGVSVGGGTDARTAMISQLASILPASTSGISLSLLV